jgi:hypothetical protein
LKAKKAATLVSQFAPPTTQQKYDRYLDAIRQAKDQSAAFAKAMDDLRIACDGIEESLRDLHELGFETDTRAEFKKLWDQLERTQQQRRVIEIAGLTVPISHVMESLYRKLP